MNQNFDAYYCLFPVNNLGCANLYFSLKEFTFLLKDDFQEDIVKFSDDFLVYFLVNTDEEEAINDMEVVKDCLKFLHLGALLFIYQLILIQDFDQGGAFHLVLPFKSDVYVKWDASLEYFVKN